MDASSSMKLITYFPVYVDYVNDGQYLITVILLKYRIEYVNTKIGLLNGNDIMLFKKIQDSRETRELNHLMWIYDQLCDVGLELNRLKGLQLFCSIGFKFILLIFSWYYSYWCFVMKNQSDISIYWFTWAIFHAITLLHLMVCCQLATSEVGINKGYYIYATSWLRILLLNDFEYHKCDYVSVN